MTKANEDNQQLDNIVIIDGLPVVPQEKFDKLQSVVAKICNSFGCVVQRLELVQDDKGETTGFAFVEYQSAAEAERAVVKMNGQKLDKKHEFKVSPFADWLKYKDIPDTYEEPRGDTSQAEENCMNWLLDPGAREQYLVRHGEETEVWWNDLLVLGKQVCVEKRKAWTDIIARWSPVGTYLATFHAQGVQLWGGPEFKALGRFAHQNVQLIDFSPKESFLVTWYNNLTVWDVKSRQRLRIFPGGPSPDHGWPVFKWSHSESYFARITEDNIHVFDSGTMKLVQPDNRKATSLYIPGVRAFAWSPSDNILSYWIPEESEKPARVVLLQLTTRGGDATFTQLAQRNNFRVVDIKLHWQSNGDFLCVKVDRYSKTSTAKERVTNFELFHMRESPIAVEVVELTEEVIAFAWEPNGVRFAVIHGDSPQRYSVSFYTMGSVKDPHVKLLKSFPKKQANHLFWSPQGTHIVLAGLKSFNGVLEFWNVNDLELLGGGDHFMCTDVEWDPSGRYVVTSVSYYRHQMENGYNLWTFQGRPYLSISREKFYQFMWRPRPPSLLDENKRKEIKSQLKARVAKYQAEEKKFERMEADNLTREKKEKMDAFKKFMSDARSQMKPLTEMRRRQRRNNNGWNSDDETGFRTVESYVEEVLSVHEEELP